MTLDDANALSEALRQAAKNRTVFLLSDMHVSAFEMPSSARKAFIDGVQGLTDIYDAVVGGSFHVRVIARLVAGAARILSGTTLHIEFFDDQSTAREWLRSKGCIACGAQKQVKPEQSDW